MQHLFVAYEKVLSLRKQAGIDIDRQVSIATKSCDGNEFYTLRFESRYRFFFFPPFSLHIVLSKQDSVMVNHVPLNTSLECVLLQRGFFVHFGLQNLGVKDFSIVFSIPFFLIIRSCASCFLGLCDHRCRWSATYFTRSLSCFGGVGAT